MRNHGLGRRVAKGLGVAALAVLVSTPAARAQAQQDLSGIWALGGRSRGISRQAPPMTAEGKKMFDANIPGFGPRARPGGNDPIGYCDPLGLVRTMLSDRPMQFVVTPNRVLQFFEYQHAWREIWTDGRQLPSDPDPTFYGISVGNWQGDTFVVNSTGFDERTWLDNLGYPHSDSMRLEERYQRPAHDTLELTVTLNDPKVYTKPWVSNKKVYKLQPDQEIAESFCVGSEEAAYNRRMRNPAAGVKELPLPPGTE